MTATILFLILGGFTLLLLSRRALNRIKLSRAKHRSLTGHARIARLITNLIPAYHYNEEQFFNSDSAPAEALRRRREGFEWLRLEFQRRFRKSLDASAVASGALADLQFTSRYRVPFQYADYLRKHVRIPSIVVKSEGVLVEDLDGNCFYDLTGSYGVNLFGYDFYKTCIAQAQEMASSLGPVLGSYHPCVIEVTRLLSQISGKEQFTFHMSGTEAVMQAVRLARYQTGRSHLVRFCGAYHGWWDDVQPGPGNPTVVSHTYTLQDMSQRSLDVLRTRSDIACVLINPLQALHPNKNAPNDSSLIDSSRSAQFNRAQYTAWLHEVRTVCTEKGIALIFDEVFVGFRLAKGGAQEYFGVSADLVVYGKTLGGGLPVGVVAGNLEWMRRFREDRPAHICLARGTFNAHPYVLCAMYCFLRQLETPEISSLYSRIDHRWDSWAERFNQAFERHDLPCRVSNLSSIWTVTFTQPSRYNWMLPYYLRLEGVALSWVGTGRLIFSLNFTDQDMSAVLQRFERAAQRMVEHGWWYLGDPSMSNASIRKSVLSEMLSARFRLPKAYASLPPES